MFYSLTQRVLDAAVTFPAIGLRPGASPLSWDFWVCLSVDSLAGSVERLFPPWIQPALWSSLCSGRVWLWVPGGAAPAPCQRG